MAMSPRKRAQVSRGIQYGILAILAVGVALAADWKLLAEKFADPEIAAGMFPEVLATALKNTLLYTASGFLFGLALGLVLALMRLSPVGPYRWMATTFIEFFRGLPALVVFIALSVGIPTVFPGREIPGGTLGIATVALGLVGGAYMAETIRAGIQAVPKGQMEAARSLGMSQSRAMVSIVVPQAFRIILPPLANELILLTKDSSLVYLLGYTSSTIELTSFGREVLNQEKSMTPLTVISLCYLLITVPLSLVVRRMEARAGKAR
jgi:polar amino acid transport system permease protein